MATTSENHKYERWSVTSKGENVYRRNCKELPRWIAEALGWKEVDTL